MSTFYTITREWCGHPKIRHVVRRRGEIFVLSCATRGDAEAFVSEVCGRVVA